MLYHCKNCKSSNKRKYHKQLTTCIERKASDHNSVSNWATWSASHQSSTKSNKNTQSTSISLRTWHRLRKIMTVSLRHWLRSQESLIVMWGIRKNWEVRILCNSFSIMPQMRKGRNLWLRKHSMRWPIWSARTSKFSGFTLNCKSKENPSKCFRTLSSNKLQTRPASSKFSGF